MYIQILKYKEFHTMITEINTDASSSSLSTLNNSQLIYQVKIRKFLLT